MKLTIFLFFLGFLQALAGNSLAQTTKLSLDAKNSRIESVLQEIERQSDFRFIYNKEKVDVDSRVNFQLQNQSVKEVLDILFNGKDVHYTFFGNNIVLSSAGTATVQQQSHAVTGLVTDSSGSPLPGVTVVVRGTTNGTITSGDGNYSLNNVPSDGTLVFSFVGMKTIEVKVDNQTNINVKLEDESIGLQEVVAVGYGTQKKVNLTGAVTSVDMDKILGSRPLSNIPSALQGTVPGLQITKGNGQPGTSMALNIRGINSINGGSPLVLLDNVPVDINTINPNDVESISVLKDAASSAIYGARAAFGVILITSKKGKEGEAPTFNYSDNFAFSFPIDLPKKATPREMIDAYKTMGYPNDISQDGHNITRWDEFLTEYEQDPSKYPDGIARADGTYYMLAERDMIKDLIENYGFQQNHNLSVTGGAQNSSYRISLGTTSQDGILYGPNDSYKRYNVTGNWTIDVTKWLKTEFQVLYAKTNRLSSASDDFYSQAMLLPSYINTQPIEINGQLYDAGTPKNNVKYAAPRKENSDNLQTHGKVILNPVKNLSITGEYTFIRTSSNSKVYNNSYELVGQNLTEIVHHNPITSYNVTSGYSNYNAINLWANYSLSLEQHSIKAMAGFNQEDSYLESQYSSADGILIPSLPSLSMGTSNFKTSDTFGEYAVRGVFGRLNYDYAGKYLLEVNARYDGSSRFPKESRYGFFPSVSAGWRISEEKFMDSSKNWLNNLKLKGSWGLIGNQNIGNYDYIPNMGSYLSGWLVGYTQPVTLNPPALVSADFTWEKVETFDLGVEFGLLKKLEGSVDWYQRDTKDMLTKSKTLPSVVGTAPPKANAANLRSKGLEVSLNWRDKVGALGYEIGVTLYDTRTHITKYDNPSGLLSDYRVGQQLGEIWGYTTDRLFQQSDFDESGNLKPGLPLFLGQQFANPGDVMYKDLNDDGKISPNVSTFSDPGDRRIIGNDTRRYQYSINGGLNWKNFDMTFILTGVGKRDLAISNDLTWGMVGPWSSIFKNELDYWTPENTDAFYPRMYAGALVNTSYNRQTQTRYLINGAHLRIQNVTLGYNLPEKLVHRLLLSTARIFVSGENLHTFDKMPRGLDPEQTNTGGGWSYPFMSSYSCGVNITF